MEPRKLGGSLKVPIVQELANKPLQSVPPRYVRVLDHELRPSTHSPLPEIPVIDFRKLFEPEVADHELRKLHNACQEWGFFQLINHGVDTKVMEKMKLEIEGFFKLPIEVKKEFNQHEGDLEGYGQAFVVSEEQKLDWGDMFYIVTLPAHLRKSHLIPNLPHTFRDAIELYAREVESLGMEILKQMGKALKMKYEEIEVLFGEGVQSMRMNYYPPCPQPELVTGLCPHSDASGLTILLQVSEVEGLQIKKDGICDWIPVSVIPNAFVINIGDMVEVLTNGKYRSVEHRATVNSERERLSMATFVSPRHDGELGPAPSIVGSETPAKFKTISVTDFLRGSFSKELKGRSHLDTLRI